MAYSYTQYTVASSNDTTTTYATPPYRSGKAATDISVAVDGVTKTAGVDYNINGTSVTFTVAGAPLATSVVRIARNTSQDVAPSTYSENTILTSAQLNATQEQLFFMAQEAIDTSSETNLAGLTFYSSSTSAPTNPTLGDLWYDTFNKYLKIYNGSEWELATPTNESFTYTSFTAESGTYSYVSVPNINTDALVFLNGVKQVRDTVKANLLASSGAKDYFIDTANNRIYFKTLGAGSVVEVILAAANLGSSSSTKIETFTATANQTVFNLSNTYYQNTNSVNIFVNGVRQSAFTETDNNTITLTNGASVGDEVVVIMNLYDTLIGSVNTSQLEGNLSTSRITYVSPYLAQGGIYGTLTNRLDSVVSVKDFGAKGDGVADDTSAFNAAFASVSNGTITIPKGVYSISGDLTISDKSDNDGEGSFIVQADGAIIQGAHKIIIDSSKRVVINGLDAQDCDLCLRGCWWSSFNDMRFTTLKMADVAGSNFTSNYWDSWSNCQFQNVVVASQGGSASNAMTFNACTFRGDNQQGWNSSKAYAFEFNGSNTNAQSWILYGGDVSYHTSAIYNIGAGNATGDVELTFDGVYFDTLTVRKTNRSNTRIVTNNCHHAIGTGYLDYAASIKASLSGGFDVYNTSRSNKVVPTVAENLVPNGDLRKRVTTYVDGSAPFTQPLQGDGGATITAQDGGFSGTYLNINSSTGNTVFFRTLTMPTTAPVTFSIVAKKATAGNVDIRFKGT